MAAILDCYIYPDVLSWEKEAFSSLFAELKKHFQFRVIEVNANHRHALKKHKEGDVWLLSRDWRKAFKFLGGKSVKKGKVFISLLDLATPKSNLAQVLFKNMTKNIPPNVVLFAHSPLNYRFFTELEGIPKTQVQFLPVPSLEITKEKRDKKKPALTIGTLAPFTSDSHFNYFLSVAHYLKKQNANLRFIAFGSGPLRQHVSEMMRELGFGSEMTIVETANPEEFSEIDVFLYTPLRNDHFIPLYNAAKHGMPVVATEIQGIDQFIEDGKTGFVVGVNEVKPMGELVLRLINDASLREGVGKKLQEKLLKPFSINAVLPGYLAAFKGEVVSAKTSERAA